MSSYNQAPEGKLKTDLISEVGKDLGWKVEESEFVNISDFGSFQTADQVDEDAYPAPSCRYRAVIERPSQNVEEIYYWFLNFLRNDMSFPQIDKIYDVSSASESSALWGHVGQRLGIQQDRASQYLRGMSELIRTLFQIVRELRILDERLEPYAHWKENKSADITLKGVFAQLVEGGANNPDSIYSLSMKHGYTVLPDLFMNTHVYALEDIDKEVDQGSCKEFNNVVKTVLKRKLYAYINWKLKTEKEFIARRKFQIQYLRQHWKTIQLYMTWARPYLRAAQRLASRDSHINSADFIGAFDMSRTEIEILAKTPLKTDSKNKHFGCVIATFSYKTKPILTYKPDSHQQMPSHLGSCEITLRSYTWHEKDIIAYKKLRQTEDIELLKLAGDQVSSAFDALKDELEKYLEEAELSDEDKRKEVEKKKEEDAKAAEELKKQHDRKARFEPFSSIGSGFVDLGKSFFDFPKKEKKKDDGEYTPEKSELKKLEGTTNAKMFVTYNVFKKTHGMINW